jgi:hypothetical protein
VEHKPTTFNNISIDRSVIGMLNTGQLKEVENISISISSLEESGYKDVAEAIRQLTKAVAEYQGISNEQRTELLDQLDELSNQATLSPERRVKPGVLKVILTGLAASLGAAGGLAEVWSTWGSTILAFFNLKP